MRGARTEGGLFPVRCWRSGSVWGVGHLLSVHYRCSISERDRQPGGLRRLAAGASIAAPQVLVRGPDIATSAPPTPTYGQPKPASVLATRSRTTPIVRCGSHCGNGRTTGSEPIRRAIPVCRWLTGSVPSGRGRRAHPDTPSAGTARRRCRDRRRRAPGWCPPGVVGELVNTAGRGGFAALLQDADRADGCAAVTTRTSDLACGTGTGSPFAGRLPATGCTSTGEPHRLHPSNAI